MGTGLVYQKNGSITPSLWLSVYGAPKGICPFNEDRRRIVMGKQIYLRINNKEKLEAIKSVCKELLIETSELSMNMLDKRVGVITGAINESAVKNPIRSKAPAFYNMPDVIVFSGLTDKELDGFLKLYKDKKIAPTPLKAIVTPFNMIMTLYELITELQKETRGTKRG